MRFTPFSLSNKTPISIEIPHKSEKKTTGLPQKFPPDNPLNFHQDRIRVRGGGGRSFIMLWETFTINTLEFGAGGDGQVCQTFHGQICWRTNT